MNAFALAAVFVVVLWWLSTGVVLKVVWLGKSSARLSVTVFSALAVLGLIGLGLTSRMTSVHAAYGAFASAVLVWAWHELAFLLGLVTGPRKAACPEGARGLVRFRLATATVIHHEIALASTLALVTVVTWKQPNQVGTHAFLVLWVMRLSAKLNVFLGVRNVSEQFVPPHLRYLLSYFRRARLNPLMPISVAVATAVAIGLGARAFAEQSSTAVTGGALVTVLLTLAVIEHLFLMLPLPDAALWKWLIRREVAEVRR